MKDISVVVEFRSRFFKMKKFTNEYYSVFSKIAFMLSGSISKTINNCYWKKKTVVILLKNVTHNNLLKTYWQQEINTWTKNCNNKKKEETLGPGSANSKFMWVYLCVEAINFKNKKPKIGGWIFQIVENYVKYKLKSRSKHAIFAIISIIKY